MNRYRQIEEWITTQIRLGSLRIGDKIPSESELCERFGVSRQTVRIAMSNLAAAGWTETRKGVGTFCAMRDRSLTHDIALVCYFSGSYIFPRIARGCDQIAHRSGFHLLLNQSEYDLTKERDILVKLQKRGVDGIIIEPVNDGEGPSNADLIEGIEREGTPVVLLDNCFRDRPFSRVCLDDLAGGRLVAEHLLGRGHRRVGILFDRAYLPKRLRRDGAVEALAAAGAAPRPEWVIGYEGPAPAGRARTVMEAFLEGALERPTAFVCTSDEEAMELFKAAEQHGVRIPGDLSVASFDNAHLAELPGIDLTSVDHPGQHMGELAMQLLVDRILNPGVVSRTVSLIAPRLVERGSVRTITPNVDSDEGSNGGGSV
jgi:GntR family transcriptional regulator, arabinose operon transcriptional repressor